MAKIPLRSPVVLSKRAVGAVGSAGQIRQGHLLDQYSFPAAARDTAKLSYWPLRADMSDAFSTRTLLNPNSAVFTATNILGEANKALTLNGSNQYLNFTATSFLKPTHTTTWAMGGWFCSTNWLAGQQGLFGAFETTGNLRSILAYLDGSGGLYFIASTDGTAAGNQQVVYMLPAAQFGGNTWHHIVMAYDSVAKILIGYVDGRNVGSVPIATIFTTSTDFKIGAFATTPVSFFGGKVEDFFAINGYQFADSDIRKIHAFRYDHSQNLTAELQRWTLNVFEGGQNGDDTSYIESDFVQDKDANSVYWDLSGHDSTDYAHIRCENLVGG